MRMLKNESQNDLIDIMVSILCITYNHENYISMAIESFLMQKTNFKYEILIHDDASTDRTALIIKEYEKKYPDIIKAIYQKENQYSQGRNVSNILLKKAIGKYIAHCEGDDYWTNPSKLQKQVDFLESNPNYILCFHRVKVVDANTKKQVGETRPAKKNKTFTTEEVIIGAGRTFRINSMVYRCEESKNRPNFYFDAPVGDHPLTLFLATLGKTYYFDECMSVYRKSVPNSYVTKNYSNIKLFENHVIKMQEMLNQFNNFTNRKYENIVNEKIMDYRLSVLIQKGQFGEILNKKNKPYYKKLPLKVKLGIRFPKLKNLFQRIRCFLK